jgi:acetyl/propionyl-CoA carboxylase alpha subunit
MQITRLLVANRGEIALRVFRTCRARGIETVAVVAPDDTGSLHARSADVTVEIASYLDPGEHVRAAHEVDADAIHPGYGFLAESAEFAAAVESADIAWIGPSPDALGLGADKLAAKEVAVSAGVPVLPTGTPAEVGYPLLIKAAAGGGGRGMRVVRSDGDLDEALAAAGREAIAAFGDGRTFGERFVERPRHVEVQLVVDAADVVVVLGERDCSVQRRHQKILEESPAPLLQPETRAALHQAAATFARAVGYRGAGTVEFLVDGTDVFFLELNGRIQVEHPVTEEVFGVDLVALQLRVAEGESLADIAAEPIGHAIEARVYAEDPRSFLPQAGRIERLRFPATIRVDAGFEEGDEVGTSYDPLLAKLVSRGSTRDQALANLARALDETEVVGPTTNLPLLRWLASHPEIQAGGASTAFLVEHPPLSQFPARRAPAPWQGAWRLNLAAPAPAPPPDVDAAAHTPALEHGSSTVTAPMPGTVLQVDVAPGDAVAARQRLLVLEAMKMETPVTSPFEATVRAVHVVAGDRVAGGATLVELES